MRCLAMCRDFGFDPLGFGEVPENLARYQEAELIHCRWAMLGVVSTVAIAALFRKLPRFFLSEVVNKLAKLTHAKSQHIESCSACFGYQHSRSECQ
jgi:hypothetical protein